MIITEETKKKINLIARVYENQIRGQAPSGKIKGGTTVVPVYGKDTVELDVVLAENVFYGKFLDQGTGKYFKENEVRGPFNPNPGKGTDGIIPRYWMSLSEALEDGVYQRLADAIGEQQAQEQLEQLPDSIIEIELNL